MKTLTGKTRSTIDRELWAAEMRGRLSENGANLHHLSTGALTQLMPLIKHAKDKDGQTATFKVMNDELESMEEVIAAAETPITAATLKEARIAVYPETAPAPREPQPDMTEFEANLAMLRALLKTCKPSQLAQVATLVNDAMKETV